MSKPRKHLLIQVMFVIPILLGTSCYASATLPLLSAQHDMSYFDKVPMTSSSVQLEIPDYEGIKRDTYYLLAYQVSVIGILYTMPEGISGWSEETKNSYSFSKWKENVQHPEWDKDDYFINYALHPYWGAAYYVRARERRLNHHQAFWYSTALSTLYEFGFEALFERPSIQDLVVTPIGGAVLGDYFMRLRRNILEREMLGEVNMKDRWLLLVTDPLGTINNKVDRFFGRYAEFEMRTFIRTRPVQRDEQLAPLQHYPETNRKRAFGIELKLRF